MIWESSTTIKHNGEVLYGDFRPQSRQGWGWSTCFRTDSGGLSGQTRTLELGQSDFYSCFCHFNRCEYLNHYLKSSSLSISTSLNWGVKILPSYVYASDVFTSPWTSSFQIHSSVFPLIYFVGWFWMGWLMGSPMGDRRVWGKWKSSNSLLSLWLGGIPIVTSLPRLSLPADRSTMVLALTD